MNDRLAQLKTHRDLMYGPGTDPNHFVSIMLNDLDWLITQAELVLALNDRLLKDEETILVLRSLVDRAGNTEVRG